MECVPPYLDINAGKILESLLEEALCLLSTCAALSCEVSRFGLQGPTMTCSRQEAHNSIQNSLNINRFFLDALLQSSNVCCKKWRRVALLGTVLRKRIAPIKTCHSLNFPTKQPLAKSCFLPVCSLEYKVSGMIGLTDSLCTCIKLFYLTSTCANCKPYRNMIRHTLQQS